MSEKYDRLRTYTVGQVLKYVSLNPEDKPKTVNFAGEPIFMGSKRYLNFKRNGCVCVECGLEGTYFALEKHKYQRTPKYHFNLYGKDEKGKEIMLTKDHIMPRAKGGSEDLDNFQPMCSTCNTRKGDNWLRPEQEIHKGKMDLLATITTQAEEYLKNLFTLEIELKARCPHDLCRSKEGRAECSICHVRFGWHCAKSHDKLCQYPEDKSLPTIRTCIHCGGTEGTR